MQLNVEIQKTQLSIQETQLRPANGGTFAHLWYQVNVEFSGNLPQTLLAVPQVPLFQIRNLGGLYFFWYMPFAFEVGDMENLVANRQEVWARTLPGFW